MKIQKALISVSDKTGLLDLAKFLVSKNIQILSTGGTAKMLRDNGLDVTDVGDYTGFPEIMDGRVKTLHPKIHGGLLGNLGDAGHVKAMQENDISAIGLVIVNLYPFSQTVASGANFDHVIENIDIGGPSMVRSAAKNFACTTIVTDAVDYAELIQELTANNTETTLEYRKKMAAKAFALTAKYDATISTWFSGQQDEKFPTTLNLSLNLKQGLRYGENPHQKASAYEYSNFAGLNKAGVLAARQIQGKELSYNNINDLDAALQLVTEFNDPAAVIIKHANPCGAAIADNITAAYLKALKADNVSAFGGIMAFNRPIDAQLAGELKKMFVEAVIAPSATADSLQILAEKKNMRLLLTDNAILPKKSLVFKSIVGGLLAQEDDSEQVTEADLVTVTKRAPTAAEIKELLFAFKIAKHVKSNAIVLTKDNATIGVGAGQMSRVDSVRIAVLKAQDKDIDLVKDSVLASDAFFPFPDGLIAAAKAGVRAIIQPGGSVKDNEVIQAADEYGVAMVFTGKRHFRH